MPLLDLRFQRSSIELCGSCIFTFVSFSWWHGQTEDGWAAAVLESGSQSCMKLCEAGSRCYGIQSASTTLAAAADCLAAGNEAGSADADVFLAHLLLLCGRCSMIAALINVVLAVLTALPILCNTGKHQHCQREEGQWSFH